MSFRFLVSLAKMLVVVPLLVVSRATAQERASEATTATTDRARLAEALFDEAKQALDRGDVQEACPKLEESLRLDAAGGTQLALGVCYERVGRAASAWHAFREALASAQRDGRADREEIAAEHLAALEPKLSRLTVVVPPSVAALRGLRVEVGNLELRPPSWGLAVPHDAGRYEISASAPGHASYTAIIILAEPADHQRVEIPPLLPISSPAKTRRATHAAAPEGSRALDANSNAIDEKLGYVFAGAAVVALVPGIYFGGRAIARGEVVNESCDGSACSPAVEVAHREAVADATRANVLIVSGLVAAGVSIYFFLSASSAPPARSTARVRPSGMRLEF